jgi:hypothetical protein
MVEEKKDDRPSSARRKQLREADANSGSIPMVSNFFTLERYYEASDKVLQSFGTAFAQNRLDEAYVYGMRYCTFCVEGITQHDYYRSGKFEARRTQTNKRVAQVLTKLEEVAECMDVEELRKEEQRLTILKKQQEERLRKQRELEQKRIDELQQRIARQKQRDAVSSSSSSTGSINIEESALAKLQRLNQPLAPPQVSPPSIPPPAQNKKVSIQFNDHDHDHDRPNDNDDRPEPDGRSFSRNDTSVLAGLSVLPPPMLPPGGDEDNENDNQPQPPSENNNAAPPSYHAILDQSRLANHDYFGPGASVKPEAQEQPYNNSLPSYDSVIKQQPTRKQHPKSSSKPKAEERLNIRQYFAQSSRLYREYQQKRLIQVSALKTYQGRTSGSTNGCTVISACVVSKHLQTHGGVTDAQVSTVIDTDCCPLLRTIRTKLGLGDSSLIIPSDVHDHMVDHKLLFQHKFVGVAGGNIVEPKHLGELYQMLQGEPGKTQHLKAGATLFFREHVISIVKFPTSPTEAIYDMIDSLPTCNGRASRTRCMSLDALKVQMEWYSSHKFSDSNLTYIERNRWDDAMADFDPRVFQAFAWADLPKPKE